jgi:hypothetical protein
MDILTPIRWTIVMLKADAALTALVGARVYADQYPQDPNIPLVFPYVIVGKIPGPLLTNASADIIWADDMITVECWDKSDSAVAAANVINRALMVLHKQAGTVSGGTVVGAVAEMELPSGPEVDAGVTYQRKGIQFRVYSQ